MLESVLFFAHYVLLLAFGIILSFAASGIQLFQKRNYTWLVSLFVFCGLLQLLIFAFWGESLVWKLYPPIIHLPITLVLCLIYRQSIVTALAAVSSAYLCCQPAKWFGLLCLNLTGSMVAQYFVCIVFLLLVAVIVLCRLAPTLSILFHKDKKSALIFGSIPMVYYLYDYSMSVYTDFWGSNNRVVIEFLPFLLCITFLLFCFVYYKEYEQKSNAEQKEQIIRIAVEQQGRELEAVKRSEQEIRILRHDMRMLLSNLSICIENDDRESAQELISSYSSYVVGTKVEYFCKNTIVNYVLSDFADKCKHKQIDFTYVVAVDELPVDEILFSSILSNALDNALNAQEEVPEDLRSVSLMLKIVNGKLLLSVKNSTNTIPTFVDGLPISKKTGHGYGAKSIRYMTERLGGHCQFAVQDNTFVLRLVL